MFLSQKGTLLLTIVELLVHEIGQKKFACAQMIKIKFLYESVGLPLIRSAEAHPK
jgi:hypothetical protein